ncbi:flavin-containing monooxygenase [Novosphingobium pentaromativorans]|uniref:Cyclohexanone monooxygenase n=1 Tax=Novosphingobium pentaromativorans US6-1 TaxID=1088721 RepID=G6EAS8_9SPHN|nr:NAD(P)/FAD-dependent oxidoreductase [Novosphingobium pentaromativorans]AIT80580.1 cyclohexanone monooxygenase [Novosphingobium pentaromativorans US6-1]EHJ61715.1 Cyclohexanone monooxygenase [Novosphingobium pentaromativorans US6-1]
MHERFDVVVIGAGFGGLHMLWKLRQMGRTAVALEKADDVGGTWYWNRYPGARCDVPSFEYSVPWDPELEQEWNWSEKYSAQPEILAYVEEVAKRHDLKRDIRFETTVTAMTRDETRGLWIVETDTGVTFEAPVVVSAAGCLSAPNLPDIPGIEDFSRPLHHTGRWPHDPVDFSGKSVGVIGTGSTGVQASTAIAAEAGHLYVFQRTAQYSLPALNRDISAEELAEQKRAYAELRQLQRSSFGAAVIDPPKGMKAFEDPQEERLAEYERRWNIGRQDLLAAYGDISTDPEVNAEVSEFVRGKIRAIVKDPEIAEKLCPKVNPLGTRRIIMDTGYFEIFNQDNVSLVDIREDPIERITETGVKLRSGQFIELDMLVIATGYDAVTGPLIDMNITGRGGRTLADKWEHGPETYLGLMMHGFPNLFTITGPQSPTVHANVIMAIEQHVEWIAKCLAFMEREQVAEIEPARQSEEEWKKQVDAVGSVGLRAKDTNNWYTGGNIPGKPRSFLTWQGGFVRYGEICDTIANEGYRGFELNREPTKASA